MGGGITAISARGIPVTLARSSAIPCETQTTASAWRYERAANQGWKRSRRRCEATLSPETSVCSLSTSRAEERLIRLAAIAATFACVSPLSTAAGRASAR